MNKYPGSDKHVHRETIIVFELVSKQFLFIYIIYTEKILHKIECLFVYCGEHWPWCKYKYCGMPLY